MKHRPIATALLLALVVSGSFTYLLSRKIASHSEAQRSLDRRYVTPSRSLQAGEVLKADNLELLPWPVSAPVSGAFSKLEDVLGRVVIYPMDRGEPILDRELAAPGSAIGLSAKIPAGMRAIALRSDEVVGVAGFLIPGSHLDVLVSYRTDRSPEPLTATVLQNAVVLAAGQQVEPDPAGKPSASTVVTLLLTPEQSERALLASIQGSIHFVLRNGGDSGNNKIEPVSLSELLGDHPSAAQPGSWTSLRSMLPVPARAPAGPSGPGAGGRPAREPAGIETILGDSRSDLRVDTPSGDTKPIPAGAN